MKRHSFFFIVLSLLSVFFCACSKVPKGFPETYSCQVKLTDAGMPIEGAIVNLTPEHPSGGIVVGGTTNADGVALVRTMLGSYTKNGAPKGNFSVRLLKSASVELSSLTDEEYYAMNPQQKAAWNRESDQKLRRAQIIPKSLGLEDSPLKIRVDSDGAMLDVDISSFK